MLRALEEAMFDICFAFERVDLQREDLALEDVRLDLPLLAQKEVCLKADLLVEIRLKVALERAPVEGLGSAQDQLALELDSYKAERKMKNQF